MAIKLRLHFQARKSNPWSKGLGKVLTRTPALLLTASILVVSARAQDPSGPRPGQQPCVQPIPSSPGRQKVTSKSGRRVSKYDLDRIGHRGIGEGANEYSLEEERELGRELSREMEIMTKLITDPVITDYVERLGQTLVCNSDAKLPVTIKVIDSQEVNAISLPGGYLYVNGGLIMATASEAELAGVMAHEIAHIAARHGTRAETRMKAFMFLSIALTYFGGPVAAAAQAAASVAGPVTFMKFSRDAEREADLLGLEYEYAAGYDPQALVQLFERLHTEERRNHSFVARLFATHPMTEDRIRRAQKEISTLLPARSAYIVDSSRFQEVKMKLAELMHDNAASKSARPILRRRTRQNDSSVDDEGPTLRRPSRD